LQYPHIALILHTNMRANADSNYIKVTNVSPTLKQKVIDLVKEDYSNLSDYIKSLVKADVKKRTEENLQRR